MTTEDFQQLKSKLSKGWINRISKMSGASPKTVWNVLNGRSYNSAVIDATIKLIEEEQKRKVKIRQVLES